jgi:hypothetical protein
MKRYIYLIVKTCFEAALTVGLSSIPVSQAQAPLTQCTAAYTPVAGQSSVSVNVEPSQPLVRTTIQVLAHQALSYNFALTRGTTLVARFQVAGGANDSIKVWLLDASNFQLYQAHQQFSYFQGTSGSVQNTGHYIYKVPQDNVYYLLLDNSEAWLLPRTVNLYIYGVLPEKTPETLALEKTISQNFSKLGQLFMFPSFQLELKHCGVVNAFSNPNITICTELAESLLDQHLEQVIGFVLFHELGHTLLRQWGYPLWDNEDAADEFATVLMILGKQKPIALEAAQWWASQTSEQEALSKIWADDRHSLSPQRARNVIHWLNQPNDLLQRWFRIFVPNMQTSALMSTVNDPGVPIDKNIIAEELRKRGCQ